MVILFNSLVSHMPICNVTLTLTLLERSLVLICYLMIYDIVVVFPAIRAYDWLIKLFFDDTN